MISCSIILTQSNVIDVVFRNEKLTHGCSKIYRQLEGLKKIFCEMKYFPANSNQCCGRRLASSKYKNKYQITGSERKIGRPVWRVRYSSSRYAVTHDGGYHCRLYTCCHNFRESFYPNRPWKISFLPRRSFLPYYSETFAREPPPSPDFSYDQYFFNFLLSCSYFFLVCFRSGFAQLLQSGTNLRVL